MSNRTATFKQSDLTRAVKAYLAAGLDVGAARIERDGTITIMTKDGSASAATYPNPDELLE